MILKIWRPKERYYEGKQAKLDQYVLRDIHFITQSYIGSLLMFFDGKHNCAKKCYGYLKRCRYVLPDSYFSEDILLLVEFCGFIYMVEKKA